MHPVALIRFAAEILVPPRCAICCAACAGGTIACESCSVALRDARAGDGPIRVRGGEPLPAAWGAPYDGVARELVTALKFRGRLELGRLAGATVAGVAARLGAAGRAVVPVPAAPLRLRRRGFDPGELIARAAAERLGAPFSACLARRSGRRQVGRDRAARLANPPRIRVVGEPPARALLVDDVLTTGATLGSCASALRAAGCHDVVAAVFARAV
jgi:predicted amidophosphoribosyltransferase